MALKNTYNQQVSSATVTVVTVTTAPTLICAGNKNRVDLALYNNSLQTIYLGYDDAVTTTTGWPLATTEKESDSTFFGAIYGVVSATTASIIVREK